MPAKRTSKKTKTAAPQPPLHTPTCSATTSPVPVPVTTVPFRFASLLDTMDSSPGIPPTPGVNLSAPATPVPVMSTEIAAPAAPAEIPPPAKSKRKRKSPSPSPSGSRSSSPEPAPKRKSSTKLKAKSSKKQPEKPRSPTPVDEEGSGSGGSERGASVKQRFFSDEEEDELADFFRDHPIFYNKSLKGYYQMRDKKARLVTEKAEEMGRSAAQISTWFTSMRSSYGRLSAEGPSGTGKKHLTTRDQWIVTKFAFLKDHIKRAGGQEAPSVRRLAPSQPPSVTPTPQEDTDIEDVEPGTSQQQPVPRRKAKRAEPVGGAVQEMVSLMKEYTSRSVAPHPMDRQSQSDAEEAWKSACTWLFYEGLALSEKRRKALKRKMVTLLQQAQDEEDQEKETAALPPMHPAPAHQYQQWQFQQPAPVQQPLQQPLLRAHTGYSSSGHTRAPTPQMPSAAAWQTMPPTYGQPTQPEENLFGFSPMPSPAKN